MQEDILAVVEASAPRRWMGVGMLATVGLLILYVAFSTPPAPGWQIFLFVMGGLALWLARALYTATLGRIELTEKELRTGTGRVIALVKDIEAVDRGVFAFKPSNGFILRTGRGGIKTWAAGLWWRIGRRIGVGGVTAAAQTKFMSEVLSAMIAERA